MEQSKKKYLAPVGALLLALLLVTVITFPMLSMEVKDIPVAVFSQSANAMISLIAPTCGLLMGVLAMTKTSFGKWVRFVWKLLVFVAIVTVLVLVLACVFLY